jgi:2-polyprenyl-3-methyl-5-hydroxy-6-metoxy-1,4-benzoquinol methylase
LDQTPAHDQHNPDLLKLIPLGAKSLIEVGCSTGALAREYKKLNLACDYFGVDIDAESADIAAKYCDDVAVLDMNEQDFSFYRKNAQRDVWVFGDALEHLLDPWAVLQNVRAVISPQGMVLACIPNAQHWSVQARLSVGDFRYEDSGLFDRTHLRWFTRATIGEMFDAADFTIVEGIPRIFEELDRDKFLPLIGGMAQSIGADPVQAMNDAMPLQYVIKAIPKNNRP